MKEIGKTHDGEHLVQMNVQEHAILGQLQEVYTGREVHWPGPVRLEDDLSGAFKAIWFWTNTKNALIALNSAVANLECLLMSPEKQCNLVHEALHDPMRDIAQRLEEKLRKDR